MPTIRVKHQSNIDARGRDVLGSRTVWLYLAVCLLHVASFAPYYTFFSLYLEQHGYAGSFIGLLWALGVIAEIGVFIYGQELLRRFSLRSLFLVATLATGIRWLLIAKFVGYPMILVAAQLLHLAGFGVFHLAAITAVQRLFAPNMQARGQALYAGIGHGAGGAVGGVLAGVIWQHVSSDASYLAAAFTVLFAAVIAALGFRGGVLDKSS